MKEKEREKERKNIKSGHYVRPATPNDSAHIWIGPRVLILMQVLSITTLQWGIGLLDQESWLVPVKPLCQPAGWLHSASYYVSGF